MKSSPASTRLLKGYIPIKLMAEIYYPAKKSKKGGRGWLAAIAAAAILSAASAAIYVYQPETVRQFSQIINQTLDKFTKNNAPIADNGSIGVWCGKNQCFWFNKQGALFKAAPRPEGNLIITIHDSENFAKIGGRPLEDRLWRNLMIILNSWLIEEKIISNFNINQAKEEITASANQFDIYFSLRFDSSANIQALRKLLKENKINADRLTYADLRMENKIYYK